MSEPLVLGIESSCDETAIGIVRGRKLLANVISSSVDEHARFGGVVPEVASRAHLETQRFSTRDAIDLIGAVFITRESREISVLIRNDFCLFSHDGNKICGH